MEFLIEEPVSDNSVRNGFYVDVTVVHDDVYPHGRGFDSGYDHVEGFLAWFDTDAMDEDTFVKFQASFARYAVVYLDDADVEHPVTLKDRINVS